MVIGAGAAGHIILKELRNSDRLETKPCCVIDDNPNKWNRIMEGVPVVGGRDDILKNVHKYNIDQILFAYPDGFAAGQKRYLKYLQGDPL